jgi:hypothetical protein
MKIRQKKTTASGKMGFRRIHAAAGHIVCHSVVAFRLAGILTRHDLRHRGLLASQEVEKHLNR